MSCVPTGRIGLAPEVSGFVTMQDESLEARLRRAAQGAQGRLLQRVYALRPLIRAKPALGAEVQQQEPADEPWPPEEPEAQADPVQASSVPRQAAKDWNKALRLQLAAALILGNQIRILAVAQLKLADRLRDLAALGWLALKWSGRAALAAPRWVQVIGLGLLGLYLAPWPDAVHAETDQSVSAQALPVVQPARPVSDGWRTVAGAIAAYHLEAPELDRNALKYRARRQVNGARQDMISWYEEATDADQRPKNRFSGAIAIEQYPKEAMQPQTFFVDGARRAALAGLSVEKLSDPYLVHNKFGAFEVADATLSGGSAGRGCLMFRHVAAQLPLQIHGWLCGAPQRVLDRTALACVLDRVDLLGAGSDQALRAYFAGVERDRKTCGTYRAASAPAGWVDANGRIPELKAAISDRSRRM